MPTQINSELYDFTRNFNHQQFYLQPSELLYINELMVDWYRMGSDWVNNGLPNYVTIDCKPENRCKIQSLTCGKNDVIIHLLSLKTPREYPLSLNLDEQDINFVPCIVKQLAQPWFNKNQIICCDSYFPLVATAEMTLASDMQMIGVIKMATNLEMTVHGDQLHTMQSPSHQTCLFLSGLIMSSNISLQQQVQSTKERRLSISGCNSWW